MSNPLPCAIDHLVVVAPTLDAGSRYVQAKLGVDLEPGGEHPRMGTHNRLLRLGDATYLEVIAIDPAAPPPGRARWFELNRLAPDTPPRLATWVVRTSDIESSVTAAGEDLGGIERMSRGALSWRITVRDDGTLPFDGVMPSLIEWDGDVHPCAHLRDRACRLVSLEAGHPNGERIWRAVESIGLVGRVTIAHRDSAHVTAMVETAAGLRTL